MDSADAIVVGGGPAGSSCAARLVRAGLDVVVIDRARFPRDKVCAGWITPAVVARLALDLDAYAVANTLQPFTGFRTGLMSRDARAVDYAEPVSYGIRRCEFDTWLLRRSGARLRTGERLDALRREPRRWIANEAVSAPVVIGAGGHFCPVARRLNADAAAEDVVVAQEIEVPVAAGERAAAGVQGRLPELYFWPDLLGYGWVVRKGDYLNIGAGRLQSKQFPAAVREFRAELETRGLLPDAAKRPWTGHAYLLDRTSRRRIVDDGVVLTGDAAGLALAPAGEGILSAVESGQMAADAVIAAAGDYSRARLQSYASAIADRFATRPEGSRPDVAWPPWLIALASRVVFASPWLTRRMVIERGFLHRQRSLA
jgi:flavin-dependent dehydrogenase